MDAGTARPLTAEKWPFTEKRLQSCAESSIIQMLTSVRKQRAARYLFLFRMEAHNMSNHVGDIRNTAIYKPLSQLFLPKFLSLITLLRHSKQSITFSAAFYHINTILSGSMKYRVRSSNRDLPCISFYADIYRSPPERFRWPETACILYHDIV